MKQLLIILLFFGTVFSIVAQEIPAEKLFERAKEDANSGDYNSAIHTLQYLTNSFPRNHDYKIYLARVYGWKEDYSAAIATLEPLTEAPGILKEAIKVMVTTQLWAENYEEVIRYSDRALAEYPDNYFKIQKAKALQALNREAEVKEVLREVVREDPVNKEALAIQTSIFKNNKDHISVSYLNTSFSNPGFNPWHLAYLEYKRNKGKVPVLARLNYGSLFGQEGGLFEIDAYPKINGKSYFYINAGAAIVTPIFPQYKAAIEYFLSLNKGFAVSLGSKYLDFDDTNILMFTGEIAYNSPNNLRINYRPYISNIENSWFLSHTMSLRVMNPVKENFLQFDIQYGSIPYAFFTSNAFTDLTSLRLGVQYQFRISENFLIQPVFMYEYEEYFPSQHRNRFNSQIITTFRF